MICNHTVEANPFADMACRECDVAALRLEWRDDLTAKPLGTHSLSGTQMKVSATAQQWPWCVCDSCGAASRGEIDPKETT